MELKTRRPSLSFTPAPTPCSLTLLVLVYTQVHGFFRNRNLVLVTDSVRPIDSDSRATSTPSPLPSPLRSPFPVPPNVCETSISSFSSLSFITPTPYTFVRTFLPPSPSLLRYNKVKLLLFSKFSHTNQVVDYHPSDMMMSPTFCIRGLSLVIPSSSSLLSVSGIIFVENVSRCDKVASVFSTSTGGRPFLIITSLQHSTNSDSEGDSVLIRDFPAKIAKTVDRQR